MPSLSRLGWLFAKEWRALLASRSFWLMLLAMAPLVGMSFIGSVHSYRELSAGMGEALNPLIGIWAPTFSAAELVAVFLLPFVAIALVTGDRQSGALKLELQQKLPPIALLAAKTIVLLTAWLIALLIPATSLLLWRSYGGPIYLPELASLALGHVLNAALTIALATVAGSLAESQASAAIVTLAATVGTWLLNFAGSIQGGWWERAAAYTPSSLVAQFQHGLAAVGSVSTAILLSLAGLFMGAIWYSLGSPVKKKLALTAATIAAAFIVIAASNAAFTQSWDLSEGRVNSFPAADERTLLNGIREPLNIDVHLAAEDPRRQDLETRALSKLRRLLPKLVTIHYRAATATGLFEQANPGYGEIGYQMAGRSVTSRATTAEGVLESVYTVAQLKPPAADDDDSAYRGHPLLAQPKWAALVFYCLWPLIIGTGFLGSLRY